MSDFLWLQGENQQEKLNPPIFLFRHPNQFLGINLTEFRDALLAGQLLFPGVSGGCFQKGLAWDQRVEERLTCPHSVGTGIIQSAEGPDGIKTQNGEPGLVVHTCNLS
jgi:hypothetical protein